MLHVVVMVTFTLLFISDKIKKRQSFSNLFIPEITWTIVTIIYFGFIFCITWTAYTYLPVPKTQNTAKSNDFVEEIARYLSVSYYHSFV